MTTCNKCGTDDTFVEIEDVLVDGRARQLCPECSTNLTRDHDVSPLHQPVLSPEELADEFGVDDLEDIADHVYEQYLDYIDSNPSGDVS